MSTFGGHGGLDELFVGMLSLAAVKVLLSLATERGLAIMLLGVMCAFLYGAMWRNVYIELPQQDTQYRTPVPSAALEESM